MPRKKRVTDTSPEVTPAETTSAQPDAETTTPEANAAATPAPKRRAPRKSRPAKTKAAQETASQPTTDMADAAREAEAEWLRAETPPGLLDSTELDVDEAPSGPLGQTVEDLMAESEPSAAEPTSEELQAELNEEVEAVVERLREDNPDYAPPPYSPSALTALVRRGLGRLGGALPMTVARRAAASVGASDLLEPDTWKGLWYMANYTAQYQGDLLKRRLTGKYETDAYGYDSDFYETVKPLLDFLYKRYWRVTVSGVENVPETGAALLVSNHSGLLPWDAAMIALAVQNEHPNPRQVRALFDNYMQALPFVALLLTKAGMIVSHPENAKRLLADGDLALVFPEGYKGSSKLFKERYHLARFSRGGFAQLALTYRAPIVPVAVVGSEEAHPVVARVDAVGRPLGLPYFPITTPLPLPSKWSITFGAPIVTADREEDAEHNAQLVAQLTDDVRSRIQDMLYDDLKDRKSVFLG